LLEIALDNMAAAIRKVSIRDGVDPRDYALVSLGGAGGQMAADLAKRLQMNHVVSPKWSSVFCALGMGINRKITTQTKSFLKPLTPSTYEQAKNWINSHDSTCSNSIRTALHMRYRGQSQSLEVAFGQLDTMTTNFARMHAQLYGFERPGASLELVTASCHFIDRIFGEPTIGIAVSKLSAVSCQPPVKVQGLHTSLWIPADWEVFEDQSQNFVMRYSSNLQKRIVQPTLSEASADSVSLATFFYLLTNIAEEMGSRLERSAWSSNIRDRRDFSCAVFDHHGSLLVNAPHIPVHLGAMGQTVKSLIASKYTPKPGEMYVSNAPYQGGSHLPDVTVMAPFFCTNKKQLLGFVANRAHHAEIGGITPGSMPANSKELSEEGCVLELQPLLIKGQFQSAAMRLCLQSGAFPSRDVDQNIADLQAQVAANQHGCDTLASRLKEMSTQWFEIHATHLMATTHSRTKSWLKEHGDLSTEIEDRLDDGTPLKLSCQVSAECFSLTWNTPNQPHPGNFNAPPAVVKAAAIYALRAAMNQSLPLNDGLASHIQLTTPSPSMLQPLDTDNNAKENHHKPAVVAGNVETSQRLVEMILRALGCMAESQGTMNNVIIGGQRHDGSQFSYYETLAGGSGAGPNFDGQNAIHSHMTNSRITDAEILEWKYPFRLLASAIRPHSGGQGRYRGGNGLIRRYQFDQSCQLSLITSRRNTAPRGLAGGANGLPGANHLFTKDGLTKDLGSAGDFFVHEGDILEIQTPGGGAYQREGS
jgi:5-oxoprolinase (ATP-hydrolysing)